MTALLQFLPRRGRHVVPEEGPHFVTECQFFPGKAKIHRILLSANELRQAHAISFRRPRERGDPSPPALITAKAGYHSAPGTSAAYGSPLSRGRRRGPSSRFGSLRQRRKCLALGGKALEQRRRLERGIAGLPGVVRQPVGDVLEADLVGIIHRAAAIDRPAIAVEPDHVDIARAR